MREIWPGRAGHVGKGARNKKPGSLQEHCLLGECGDGHSPTYGQPVGRDGRWGYLVNSFGVYLP